MLPTILRLVVFFPYFLDENTKQLNSLPEVTQLKMDGARTYDKELHKTILEVLL